MHSTRLARRCRWWLGLSLACVLSVVLLAGAPRTLRAADGQKWALVVGVDHYDSDQITPLKCAGADARALAKALIEVGGFPSEHVVLMTGDAAVDDRPTAVKVLQRLAGFGSVVGPGDEFVFFFSGHGMEQDGESFLLTSDSTTASTALLHMSSLSVKRVQQALTEIKASRILKLVDACRNDPRSGRGASDYKLTEHFARDLVLAARQSGDVEAAVTLFSCKKGQRSYEGYNGHGYFTYFLVAGLRGEAAGADGTVTLPALVTFLERKVAQTVRLRETGKEQTPWADISGTGALSWVLGRGKGGAVAVLPSPSRPARAPAPELLPSATPRPVEAAPPKVRVTSPSTGAHTSRDTVVVAATVTGGGGLAEVTVSVNGQDVPVGSGLRKSAHGAMVNVAVPLDVGENTIVVAAMSTAGQPAQAAVTVERKALVAPVSVESPAVAAPSTRPAAVTGPKRSTKPTRPKPRRAAPQTVAAAPPAARPQDVTPPTGNEMTNPKDGSVLIRIPGGTFTMGSDESDAYDDEKPPHAVTLSPYLIGKYTVTMGQFRRFVDATGYRTEAERGDGGYVWKGSKWEKRAGANWRTPRGDGQAWAADMPVVQVSWNDAEAYCQWSGVRLPTEAEWEFAARGSEGRKYPWGNELDASRCRSSVGGALGSAGGPMPVGSYPQGASPFGCLDMAGNVLQWTGSWYERYPGNSLNYSANLYGQELRVLRGGSWVNFNPRDLRGANRDGDLPVSRNLIFGFRVARTP